MRRWLLLIPLVLILLAGAVFWWWSRPLPVLNVVTWPGTYGRAQAAAQMQAYGAAEHVDVRIQQWTDNGTLDELRRAMAARRAGDVVDLELPVAVAACRQGLLEPIDPATLPPGADGAAAQRDFLAGMIGRCFVGTAVYAQMIACLPCRPGASLADLFALVAGGERIALPRGAKITLEMALLADGVPPGQVYALLATDTGVARAFARLDAIRANIVWTGGSAQAVAALERGEVGIAAALTADMQTARKVTGKILAPQFYEADVLAVPAGGAKKDLALDYVRHATGTAPLANMVRFAPYAPPRRSARAAVAQLPPGPLRDFVAGQGDALNRAFAIDDAFWADNGAALEARFRAWADS